MYDSFQTCVSDVLRELIKYKGEPIVAYDHPLHDAIRALEEKSRWWKLLRDGRGQNKLHPPAAHYWFYMLWASREGAVNIPFTDEVQTLSKSYGNLRELSIGCEANSSLARAWGRRLGEELLRQRNDALYHESLREEWRGIVQRWMNRRRYHDQALDSDPSEDGQ